MALTVRNVLARHSGGYRDVACFVQDPAYSEIDHAVLGHHGMIVLSDPNGLLVVDESSAVIASNVNFPVKDIICDIAKPALIIWDKVLEVNPLRSYP